MTTPLTDFLLARIAEDERRRMAYWHDIECGMVMSEDKGCTCESQAHILAECEAKRRIVELATMTERPQRLMDRLTFPTANAALNPALRLLAAVYADHPDYEQEWRP